MIVFLFVAYAVPAVLLLAVGDPGWIIGLGADLGLSWLAKTKRQG